MVKYFYLILTFFMIVIFSGDEPSDSPDNVVNPSTYDGGMVYYVGADGENIELVNNPYATDVTYKEVMEFIDDDTTDDIDYNESCFTCGDYAELVHNNAENKANISCAWVAVGFDDFSLGHACNAFNTTDKGMIFIDCTEADKKVNLVEWQEYVPERIHTRPGGTIYESMGVVYKYKVFW